MKITIELLAATAGFISDTNRASKAFQKDMKALEKAASDAGKRVGLALAAVATGTIALVKSSIDAADEISKLSQKVGVSTEALSGLSYAADLSDVSLESLSAALQKQSKNAFEAATGSGAAAEAYKVLGISVLDAGGAIKSNDALFIESIERLSKYEDGIGKIAVGQAIFGKSFADLIPLVNGGAEGVRLATEELARFGGIIDGATGKAAEDFNDTLTRIKTVVKGLGLSLAKEFLPYMQEMVERFKDPAFQTRLKETVKGLADLVVNVAQAGAAIGGFLANTAGFATFAGETIAAKKFGAAIGDLPRLYDELGAKQRKLREAQERDAASILGLDKENVKRLKEEVAAIETKIKLSEELGALPKKLAATAPAALPSAPPPLVFNPPTDTPRPSRSGRSSRELESEAQRLIASLSEQIALYGDLTKAEEVRISLANGYYGVVTPAQSAELQRLAGIIEARGAETEAVRRTADAQRAANEALEEATNNFEGVLDGLKTEEETIRDSYARRIDIVRDAQDRGIVGAERAAEIIRQLDAKQLEDIKKIADEVSEYWTAAAKGIQGALADFLFDPFKDGLRGLLSSTIQVIQRIAAEAAAARIAEALFGAPGGGGGGGLLQAGASALSAYFGGGFANGGNPPVGKVSLVGERGPELIIPRSASTVISNEQLRKSMGQQSGRALRIVNAFDTGVIGDYLGSEEGEELFLNVVSRNGARIRSAIGA